MRVTKKSDNGKLTVFIEGRLDTTTSPQLSSELEGALDGVKELVLDLTLLEYISSAGLRVLLTTEKTMKGRGKMVVKNVSEMVMEVFEITGFADILTIE